MLYSFQSDDKKYAYSIEQDYIDKYNACEKGYNMNIGFGWNIADRRGENNPMYGKVSGNASQVYINGIVYNSVSEASLTIGKSRNTIVEWCRDLKNINCYYI